jgi:hypothetical protein
MDAGLADLLCKQEKYVEAEKIATQVLRRCDDVYAPKQGIRCYAAWILSTSCRAQGRLEEALEAIRMAFEDARTWGPNDELTKKCKRNVKEITQEISQLCKPWGGDFASMNSPLRGLNEVTGHMDSDLGLLRNDMVSTFLTSWPDHR